MRSFYELFYAFQLENLFISKFSSSLSKLKSRFVQSFTLICFAHHLIQLQKNLEIDGDNLKTLRNSNVLISFEKM